MIPRYDLDDADVGQYDEPVWLREDEPCRHEHVATETGYPVDRSGRCEVMFICEDCGQQLGHAGWDSVL